MKKQDKVRLIRLWAAEEERRLLFRAEELVHPFYREFYVKCIKKTTAALRKVFSVRGGYFSDNIGRTDRRCIERFYRLTAMHHSIRTICGGKRELRWQEMRRALREVYFSEEGEEELSELLCRCAFLSRSGFRVLFPKVTAKYLFGERSISCFSFAFIGDFWYNSYNDFMGAFTGYLPFSVWLCDP